jgi:AcrR family transcriptional regulator
MSKGEETRAAVLDEALRLSSAVGFTGLTIGVLADRSGMSKSGLFGHFRSKEHLQLAVIDRASELFAQVVVQPALKLPRGEVRLRELFDRKLRWDGGDLALPGGCFFTRITPELSDQPAGPVRDRFVRGQRDWLDVIATVFRSGISEGQFSPDADPDQFAHDLHGLLLAYHDAARLMGDPKAEQRAWFAFEALLRPIRL